MNKERLQTDETRLELESTSTPTYTDVCKVIRRPRLPSCGQLGPHDDAIGDNLTVFEHCRRRTQIRAVGPRTLPRVWSDITSRILPPRTAVPACARINLVLALRASGASPATRLQCHPAAIPGTTGEASGGSPVGWGARPLPLPRFKAALRGAGSSYLAAVPGRAGRGAGL